LLLGTENDDNEFVPEYDWQGNETRAIATITIPSDMTVNPKHLGTVYELRVIDGVLDNTHELD